MGCETEIREFWLLTRSSIAGLWSFLWFRNCNLLLSVHQDWESEVIVHGRLIKHGGIFCSGRIEGDYGESRNSLMGLKIFCQFQISHLHTRPLIDSYPAISSFLLGSSILFNSSIRAAEVEPTKIKKPASVSSWASLWKCTIYFKHFQAVTWEFYRFGFYWHVVAHLDTEPPLKENRLR